MLKIDDYILHPSERFSTEICLERPRKYPAGLPVRLSVRCTTCPHRCTIDLRLPDAFPSAYVAKLEGVLYSLCEKRAEEEAVALPVGPQNPIFDASE